jgi:hypothetical protein
MNVWVVVFSIWGDPHAKVYASREAAQKGYENLKADFDDVDLPEEVEVMS